MLNPLKFSTAVTLQVGPFVSITDGFTPATGLTAGTVDEIGVYKAGATAITSISGTTTFTHRAGGIYTLTLSISDTSTLGQLLVYVRDDAVCLPLTTRFVVIPQVVYDALISPGTDPLSVNTARVANTVVTGPNDLKADVTAVALSTAELNKIADAVLRRGFSAARLSTQAGIDAAAFRSLLGVIAAHVNRMRANDATGRVEVYQENDTTIFGEKNYTASADAEPITELDTV